MKGIVGFFDKREKRYTRFVASENVDESIAEFEELKKNASDDRRDKYRKHIEARVVEETDDLNGRLAYYILPQSSRFEFDKTIIGNVRDSKVQKRVNQACDWATEQYGDSRYRFSFSLDADSSAVFLTVFDEDKPIEKCRFSGKKPSDRAFWGD